MPAKVDKEMCLGCGACQGICPVEAIEVKDDGKAECNEELCISCGACVGACPIEAITVE